MKKFETIVMSYFLVGCGLVNPADQSQVRGVVENTLETYQPYKPQDELAETTSRQQDQSKQKVVIISGNDVRDGKNRGKQSIPAHVDNHKDKQDGKVDQKPDPAQDHDDKDVCKYQPPVKGEASYPEMDFYEKMKELYENCADHYENDNKNGDYVYEEEVIVKKANLDIDRDEYEVRLKVYEGKNYCDARKYDVKVEYDADNYYLIAKRMLRADRADHECYEYESPKYETVEIDLPKDIDINLVKVKHYQTIDQLVELVKID